jgi:hypothetical protein
MPQLLAPWEVTLMGRIHTAGVSLAPSAWLLLHTPAAERPRYRHISS